MAAQGPRSDPEYSPRTLLRTLSSIGDQIPGHDAREIDFVLAAKAAAENGATAEEIATLPFFTDAHGFSQARYSSTKIKEWIDILLDRLQDLDGSHERSLKLRVCWPVLGRSRIYLLISRLRAHPGPGRISRPTTGKTQSRGRGGRRPHKRARDAGGG